MSTEKENREPTEISFNTKKDEILRTGINGIKFKIEGNISA